MYWPKCDVNKVLITKITRNVVETDLSFISSDCNSKARECTSVMTDTDIYDSDMWIVKTRGTRTKYRRSVHEKGREMNPSPTANRSFLHGSSRKAALISDKVVYATLDSLALKRARLPLQLLPADNGNLVEKTEKADKEKKPVGGKTTAKRTTYKVYRLLCINHDLSYRELVRRRFLEIFYNPWF